MLDLESGRATVFFMTQHTTESSSLFGTEIAPQFKSVKNEKELRGWLSRAYFSPKHNGEVYYNADVTPDNVLEYITLKPRLFPQTPSAIASLWKILPSLQEDLGKVFAKDDFEEKRLKEEKLERLRLENLAKSEVVETLEEEEE